MRPLTASPRSLQIELIELSAVIGEASFFVCLFSFPLPFAFFLGFILRNAGSALPVVMRTGATVESMFSWFISSEEETLFFP